MSNIDLFVVIKIDSGRVVSNVYHTVTFGDTDADGQWRSVDMRSRYTANAPDTMNILAGYYSGAQAAAPQCAGFGQWKIMNVATRDVIRNTKVRTNGVDATIVPCANRNMFISVPLGNSAGTGLGGIGGADGISLLGGGRAAAKCDIAEVIVYDTMLSDSLRQRIEQYLEHKPGFLARPTLPYRLPLK
jgi:hypothetical protein